MAEQAIRLPLRERNKLEKLRRIRAASHRLFGERGFEATSMRDIAGEAHVGLATLFLYADNKRDLLFLAFSEDLDALASTPFDHPDAAAPLLDQLVAAFAHFFRFYDRNRPLARDLLREIAIYTAGRQAEHFQATREATVEGVERLIALSRARGTIGPRADDGALAHLLFDLFTNVLRRWLGGDGTLEAGLAALAAQFRLVMDGFAPTGLDAPTPAQNLTEPVRP